MKLYLAGPMRNRPFFNQQAFLLAASSLRGKGHEIISPSEIDAEMGLDLSQYPNGTEPLPEGFTLEEMIRRDLDAIDTCDGIVLLPGWQQSTGATLERAYARFVGKPVYEYEEF